jgi:DNA mismatch repair protein MutS
MEDQETSLDYEQKMIGFSLLWKSGDKKTGFFELDEEACHDLNLEKIINFINPDTKKQSYIKEALSRISTDPELINYRVSILEDFIENDQIARCLESLMPNLEVMSGYNEYLMNNNDEKILLHDVSWRLYVLDNYITCITEFDRLYSRIKGGVKSEGLRHFFEFVENVVRTGSFVGCKDELPGLIEKISNIKSITIGINLDFKLAPIEATLISINDKKIEKRNIFNRLFSNDSIKSDSTVYSLYEKGMAGNIDYRNPGTIKNINIKLNQMFNEMSGMLYGVIKPIENELRRYSGIKTRILAKLKDEFRYYMDVSNFIRKIVDEGLPMCKPSVFEKEKRAQYVKNNYNINLALRFIENGNKAGEIMVKNDVRIDNEGRILIITGPNQGGKTTYLNAVGLTQIFAQAGIFVPGTEAGISVFDNILTHFPLEEKPDKLEGRLGEESKRLNEIFDKITRYSLVLLNESLSSTSPGESVYLASDLMKIFRMIGTSVIYTTHLHELAIKIKEINDSVEGDARLLSLVSIVEEYQDGNGEESLKFIRSYKIIPNIPIGNSYAKEIAIRNGIDFEQLKNKMMKRGVI